MLRKRKVYEAFLHSTVSSPPVLTGATELLRPLIDYDSEHCGDLVRTLRTYFICNQNASRTAETLYLHRNGLLYRLNRVEEILGSDLSCRETSLALEIAIRALDNGAEGDQCSDTLPI